MSDEKSGELQENDFFNYAGARGYIFVYEKGDTLNLDEGFGIQLSANSISVLNKIGFIL